MRGFSHRDAREACSDKLGNAPSGPAGGDLDGMFPNPRCAPTGVVAGTYERPVLTVRHDGRISDIANARAPLDPATMKWRIEDQVTVKTGETICGPIRVAAKGTYEASFTVRDASGATPRIRLQVLNTQVAFEAAHTVHTVVDLEAADTLVLLNASDGPATFTHPTGVYTSFGFVRRVQ